MGLDLSKLNAIAFKDFQRETDEKQPATSPTEPLLAQEEYKTIAHAEKPAEGHTEGLQGLATLQRQAEAVKLERERSLAICKEYQQNIKTSGQLQTDILKGAQAGESIYSLFLKACKAVSLMTSNSLFYSQLENDVRAVYGYGLLDPLPLEIEQETVQGRLQHLLDALEREIDPDDKDRIQRAIKAHRAKIAELGQLIENAKSALTHHPEGGDVLTGQAANF